MLASARFTAGLISGGLFGEPRGGVRLGCRRNATLLQLSFSNLNFGLRRGFWRTKGDRCQNLINKELGSSSSCRTLEDGSGIAVGVQASYTVQSLQVEIPRGEQLQEYLGNMYHALGLQHISLKNHVTVSGSQVLMGMEGQWQFTWNMDGRFYERYEGHELHFEWAHDGEHGPWSADAAGRVCSLGLDDREVCLLASWVRSGYWLTDEGQKLLSIHLEWQISNDRETTLKIQLKNSKVMAYLVVENASWLPLHLSIKAFGSVDKWEFRDWQPILPGCGFQFARAIEHSPPAGGSDLYSLNGVKVENFDELVWRGTATCSVYAKPTSMLVPRNTWSYPQVHINKDLPHSVMMVQAESRHYLVRPLVNGQDIGYFIVDTGASSLTIAPHKANELGMYKFGEAYVTGVEGEVKCQFRRAKSFQIGPLTITDPIFMEVPMAGVVRGVSPVAGICGYDIFFYCLVEMSYKKCTLSFYDPVLYNKSFMEPFRWQNLFLLENVPHVPATFDGNDAIFLLDTGAGGVDLIFHGRAVVNYKLEQSLEPSGMASVKGINTSGKGLQVQYGVLKTLQVAGISFQNVKALYPTAGTGASLDFSEYTAGVICGDLLKNLNLVLDYGRQRFALIDIKDGSPNPEVTR